MPSTNEKLTRRHDGSNFTFDRYPPDSKGEQCTCTNYRMEHPHRLFKDEFGVLVRRTAGFSLMVKDEGSVLNKPHIFETPA